jgi:hypothetical protein
MRDADRVLGFLIWRGLDFLRAISGCVYGPMDAMVVSCAL